jgi:hypothetical protein
MQRESPCIAGSGIWTPVAGFGAGSSSQGFTSGTNALRAQLAFRVVF